MKYCPKCRKEKNIKEFSKSKNRKDGLCGWCKDCKNISLRKYHKTHKKAERIYRQKHREHLLKWKKEDYNKNKSRRKKLGRVYRLSHKNDYADYFRNRRKTDLNFKLSSYMRNSIGRALRGNGKSENTTRLIGCSIEFLKQHLESKFTEGMTWLNYGKWHVDHIKPCVSFDLSKPKEQRKCFHYTNLQPLWAIDNLAKGDKYEY
jgi:hypothetical protein